MDTMGLQLCSLLLLFIASLCEAGFQVKPSNVASLPDLEAKFTCQGEFDDNNVIWIRISPDDLTPTTIALNGDIVNGAERMSVEYDAITATSVLTISGVATTDVAFYQCQLPISSSNAYSQLVVLETNPQCSSSVQLDDMVEDEELELKCAVTYHSAVPWAPTMVWRDTRSGDLPSTNETNDVEARYTYTGTAKRDDHGLEFECYTDFPALSSDRIPVSGWDHDLSPPGWSYSYQHPESMTVNFQVEDLVLENPVDEYNPGERLQFSAQGRPTPTFYWVNLLDNTTVDGNVLEVTAGMEGDNNYTYVAYNRIRSVLYEKQGFVPFTVVIPTTTTTTPAPSTPSSTTEDDSGGSPDPDGLAAGAIAGIVVGCILGLLLILLLIYCCIRRNKAPKNDKDMKQKPLHADQIRNQPQMVLPPDGKPPSDISFIEKEKGPPPYNPYAPPPVKTDEGLVYADLAFEDKPRSRRPIQVYENTDYADLL